MFFNYRNKKEFSDVYKLKTLGLSDKKLISIFNLTFVILMITSFVLGLSSFVYLYSLNNKFEPEFFRKYGLFFNAKPYSTLIVLPLFGILFVARFIYFKKKLGSFNDIKNKKTM